MTQSRIILPSFRGRGVVVRRNAAVAIVSGTITTMVWNVASYDPETMWDGGQLFTAPAGTKFVRFDAYIQWATGGTGIRNAEVRKNGVLILATGRTFDQQVAQAATARDHNLHSPMVKVSDDAGPYFVRVQHTQGASLNVQIDSWFAMQIIE